MNEVTFTAQDQRELEMLENRYAPRGVRQLRNDTNQLEIAVRRAESPEGKDAARRAFWQTHTPMKNNDAERLTALHEKACKAKSVECKEAEPLRLANMQGLISDDEYRRRLNEVTRQQKAQLTRRALDLIYALHALSEHHTFASTSTAEQRRKVATDFLNDGSVWQRAIDRFREIWQAADPETKGELQRMQPELYAAAIKH